MSKSAPNKIQLNQIKFFDQAYPHEKKHIFKYIKKIYAKFCCIIQQLIYLKYKEKSQFGYITNTIKYIFKIILQNIFENVLKNILLKTINLQHYLIVISNFQYLPLYNLNFSNLTSISLNLT